MSTPRAVFLSYASQDAEPALRICEALRAVGLEAWFDQSELRGGDAWDQKIRRQIRECAIFMPLISAQTNARAEGYFRLEWKLAVDRSHLMADDEPFLFPVVVDESTESDSRVPDRFREVQWTRLSKETPQAIAARVARLLAREERVVARPALPERSRGAPRWVWPAVGIAIFMFFVTWPLWAPKRESKPVPAAAAPSPPGGEAAQLAKRALDVTRSVSYTRDNLAVAADLARKATELDSTLAAAWGARAKPRGCSATGMEARLAGEPPRISPSAPWRSIRTISTPSGARPRCCANSVPCPRRQRYWSTPSRSRRMTPPAAARCPRSTTCRDGPTKPSRSSRRPCAATRGTRSRNTTSR